MVFALATGRTSRRCAPGGDEAGVHDMIPPAVSGLGRLCTRQDGYTRSEHRWEHRSLKSEVTSSLLR
jgi:hypothetical protein